MWHVAYTQSNRQHIELNAVAERAGDGGEKGGEVGREEGRERGG